VNELLCADRGAGNDKARVCMKDAEFGCGSCCHIRVRTVRGAFGGHWGEAHGSHFRGQGFKSGGCSRCRADNIDVVKVCDDLRCRVSCGGALEGALESQGEKKRPEGVPLFDATGGEDGNGVVGRTPEKNSRWPAVRPGKETQEGGAVFLSCVEDGLARHAVEGVLAVQGEEQVIWVCIEGRT
jgi:hypothetical protein